MEEISRAFYSGEPGSLASEKVFRKNHPEFDKNLVKQFFQDNEVVRRYYGRKRPSKKFAQQMVSYYPLDRVHVDLADFRKKSRRYKYCFTAVCCYTKFLVAIAIRNKNAGTVLEAFKVLHETIVGLRPLTNGHTLFVTDAGREFHNKHLRKYFKKRKDVTFHIARSSLSKAFLAERTNRTLRGKLELLCQHDRSRRWYQHLPAAVESHNRTPRSELGDCTPMEAVRLKRRFVSHMLKQRSKRTLTEILEQMAWGVNRAGLHRGDFVRLTKRVKWPGKGSEQPKIGEEIFKISHLKLPSLNKPKSFPYYRLRDLNGAKVSRLFRRHELVKVSRESLHHPN